MPDLANHARIRLMPPLARTLDDPETLAERAAKDRDRLREYRRAFDATATSHQRFLFGGMLHQRAAIRSALEQCGAGDAVLARYDACCSQTWLWRHKSTGLIRTRTNTCGNRWCPRCRSAVQRRVARALHEAMQRRGADLSMVTLTQPGISGESLHACVRRLRRAWLNLRRDPRWASRVRGGAAVLEVTRNKTIADAWHAHLHVVCQHRFIPINELADAWNHARGGTFASPHIRRVDNPRQQCNYIAKYLAKPYPAELLERPDLLARFMDAMYNQRLVSFFGSWIDAEIREATTTRKLTARQKAARGLPTTDDEDAYEFLGELNDLIGRARAGDRRAGEILALAGFGVPELDLAGAAARQARPPPKPPPLFRPILAAVGR